jgi:hypothetical protein
MRKTRWLVLGSVLVVFGCGAEAPTGPPLDMGHSVADLMSGMIDPAADVLWDAVGTILDENGETYWQPETEEDWIAVRAAAMTIKESANLLMLGDRPHDQEGWMQYAREMSEAAGVALEAVDSRDPDRVFDVGEAVYNSCNTCHSLYWVGDEQRGRVGDAP